MKHLDQEKKKLRKKNTFESINALYEWSRINS